METWRKIKNYEDSYEVSDLGNVRSLSRVTTRQHNEHTLVKQPIKEKLLRQTESTVQGYKTVGLCKNGKCSRVYVHALVAEAFIGERPSDKHHILHGSEGKTLNNASNLSYGLPVENAKDRYRDKTDARGENNPRSKYTESKIADIKNDLLTTRQYLVAMKHNIPKSTIRSIKQGKRWNHVETTSNSN